MLRRSGGLVFIALIAACSSDTFTTGTMNGDGDVTNIGGDGDATGDGDGDIGGGTTSGGNGAGGSNPSGGANASGGRPPLPTGGATSSGGSGSGGALPPDHSSCPMMPPMPETSCEDGLMCEYGMDPRPGCREVHSCSGGKWVVASPDCAPAPHCLNDYNPAASSNTPCSTAGETCWWDTPLHCVCNEDLLGWTCDQKSDPCPALPPPAGQPCMGDVRCTYYPCPSPHRTQVACEDGVWTPSPAPCE